MKKMYRIGITAVALMALVWASYAQADDGEIAGVSDPPANQNIPLIPPHNTHLGPGTTHVIPTSLTNVGNCIPFGGNMGFGFTGFIYRNVPGFTITPGTKFAFDLGNLNNVDVRRNIYFAVANINPGPPIHNNFDITTSQGIKALAWTKVASDTQVPLNPKGNFIMGDYELIYTAEASFSFPGGGLIVGFGGSPPGAYADTGCDQVLVRTTATDASGMFYARFFSKPDQTLGVLDTGSGGTAIELGGIVIGPSAAPKPAAPPPFSIDKPLPDPNAHLCLPPFMVQDPTQTHTWWARATGSGNLEIELIALAVNPSGETGSVTMKVFDPTGAPVGSPVTVVHPVSPSLPGAEASSPPFVISGAAAGDLYRIEVNVAPPPPPPGMPARHYRLELKGASMLGANSPLQAQSEHDDARWAVNVGASENLNVLVSGGPEAPATTGTVETRNPSGALVASASIGTPVNVASAAAGQWTIAVLGANGHYVIDKTSGADKGLYVTWMTWGYGTLSGSITRGGVPNPTPVTVEITDNLTGAVQTLPATSSYSVPKIPVGEYTIKVITPPSLLPAVPASAIRFITCDGAAVADFDIPNRPPSCSVNPGDNIQVFAGNLTSFTVTGTDPDPDEVLTLSVSGLPSGASMNPPLPVSGPPPVSSTFTWTPTAADRGSHQVVLTVKDLAGAQSQCTVTIEVLNNPPHCEAAAPSIAELWPPNHKMVNINVQGVTDPDGDPLTIKITQITQDEPLNTVGDGNTEPDGGGIGTSTAQVRAERTGTPKVPGNGRVYKILFTASDGQGGTCNGSVSVCVPHDQGKGKVCIDDRPAKEYDSITGAAVNTSLPPPATKPVAAEFAPEAEASLTFGVENYPNPFNPSTTIRYTLPEASNVRLTIYNVLGQEVRTLVNAAQSRGVYNVQWNGRDASGRQVATGVYIYRLEAGANVATKNMIFAK